MWLNARRRWASVLFLRSLLMESLRIAVPAEALTQQHYAQRGWAKKYKPVHGVTPDLALLGVLPVA